MNQSERRKGDTHDVVVSQPGVKDLEVGVVDVLKAERRGFRLCERTKVSYRGKRK
jgi:hypothetical protein